jgi:hypothetical protein
MPAQFQPILLKLADLGDSQRFWNETRDGLAILASPKSFRVFHLPREMKEKVFVADTFFVKPLIRYLQSADRFQVLCLTREHAHVCEGNRYSLDPVATHPGSWSLADLLGEQVTEPHITVTGGPGGIHAGHGQGSRKDEAKVDSEKFFRKVDHLVMEQVSKPTGLSLILFASPDVQSEFRRVSQNAALLADGVETNPTKLAPDRIREMCWQVMLPHYEQRLNGIIDDFRVAQSRNQGSADISDTAKAALAGRVGRLLLDADREAPGRIDETGAIRFAEPGETEINDVTNDLAELVLRNGGEVIVVPSDKMPTTSGIAALFRY